MPILLWQEQPPAAAFETSGNQSNETRRDPMNSHLRVATLNVQVLGPRLKRIWKMIDIYHLDVLCLQEVKVTETSWPAIRAAARKQGLQAALACFHTDEAGRRSADCMVLSKLPLQQMKDLSVPHAHRTVLTTVEIPGRGQVLVASIHCCPGDLVESRSLVMALLEESRRLGKPLAILGDFNLIPGQGIVGEAEMKGWLQLPETDQERIAPTRHGGRHIDFLMSSHGLDWIDRRQHEVVGMADHDLVSYVLPCGQPRTHLVPRQAPPITRENVVDDEEFDSAFKEYEDEFRDAAHHRDTKSMWDILSRTAETLLIQDDASLPQRHWIPKLTRIQPGKDICRRSCLLSKLHKLEGYARHVAQYPLDFQTADTMEKEQRSLAIRVEHIAALDLYSQEGRRELQTIVEARETSEQQRRVGDWQREIAESDAKAFAWLRRDPAIDKVSAVRSSLWPQNIVDEEAVKWQQIWDAPPPPPEHVDKY